MADLFETNPKDIRIFVQVETTISVGALPCFTFIYGNDPVHHKPPIWFNQSGLKNSGFIQL